MEKRFVRRDGVPVWVRISATVVIDPALRVPQLALAEIEDLEMRHDIQAGLRTTDARLRLALERMQFGVVEFDTRARMFWTNATAAAMSGDELPAETWLALTGPRYAAWVERIHPDDRRQRELQMRVLDAGDTDMVNFEYQSAAPMVDGRRYLPATLLLKGTRRRV